MRLPNNDGTREWTTFVTEYEVLARGSGTYWSLTWRNMETGMASVNVDASYHFEKGMLRYVPPEPKDNPDQAFARFLSEKGTADTHDHLLRAAFNAGIKFAQK